LQERNRHGRGPGRHLDRARLLAGGHVHREQVRRLARPPPQRPALLVTSDFVVTTCACPVLDRGGTCAGSLLQGAVAVTPCAYPRD